LLTHLRRGKLVFINYFLQKNIIIRLYEYPIHEIASGLADTIKTLMIAFFFGAFVPISYLLSIIGIILYYYTEKV
jgi:hypothetical protein